jgi:basic amino acid/polyamine antiporter, APA family
MKLATSAPPLATERCALDDAEAPRRLGLWDTVGIIVGIVVGTAIFISPPLVFQNVSGPWQAIGIWSLGGALSLCGALCYAELATAYPRLGGDYEYLNRAFGPCVGFVFGWAQLCIILTGSIGALAYAFADYGVALWGLDRAAAVWLAIGAVMVLSIVNLFGVMAGKATQNVLTAAKILGLALIVATGLFLAPAEARATGSSTAGGGFGLALVFVLYAYGGWNDAAFVSAEVRDGKRNIPRSLFLSIGIITLVYLLVNVSFLWVLGFEGVRQSSTPAADVLARVAGPGAAGGISLLVMISALSAINGLILTGSRILRTLGDDHRLFSLLARGNRAMGVPIGAIGAQAMISAMLIATVGTDCGRQTVDRWLGLLGLPALPWQDYHGGFETLVAASAPIFWMFFLLTGIALFVLRIRDKHRERPFTMPWFPLPPLVFCLTSLFMLHASLVYAKGLFLLVAAPVALGVPLYLLGRKPKTQSPAPDEGPRSSPFLAFEASDRSGHPQAV